MLNSLCFTIIIATLLGVLSGLGVGGGTILILWLTLVLHEEPSTARIINLLFFIPSAIIATIFHGKQRKLNLHVILPAMLAGCISACLFSRLSNKLDTEAMKKLFGLLLLVVGTKELLYKQKKD